MRPGRTILPLAALLLAGACAPGGGRECTLEAVASVSVSVVDPGGQPVEGARVDYAVDGGDPAPCESWPDGGFVCGWELPGDFTITIEAAGYAPDEFALTVEAGACHVRGVQVERVLQPTS